MVAACSGGGAGDSPTLSSGPATSGVVSTPAPVTGSPASSTSATTTSAATSGDGAAVDACRQRRREVRARLPDIDEPSLTDVARVIGEDEAAGCAALCGPLLAALADDDPCPDAPGPGAP